MFIIFPYGIDKEMKLVFYSVILFLFKEVHLDICQLPAYLLQVGHIKTIFISYVHVMLLILPVPPDLVGRGC